MSKALILSAEERAALLVLARQIRLDAGRLERHFTQNISAADVALALANARALLAKIERRVAEALGQVVLAQPAAALPPSRWIVMAKVEGGVTGYRTAPLKSNGQVRYFPTFEAADLEAARLVREMNGPHRTANFTYWAASAAVADLL